MARMTAFSPGQSPPPVKMPTRTAAAYAVLSIRIVGWDASRPVPWPRLMREWMIYAGIMTVIFLLFFRSGNLIGIIGGLLASGPLYLGFGYLLAKFGYQRKTLKELRTPQAAAGRQSSSSVADDRPKPAPTRRTSAGPNRRPTPSRKRR